MVHSRLAFFHPPCFQGSPLQELRGDPSWPTMAVTRPHAATPVPAPTDQSSGVTTDMWHTTQPCSVQTPNSFQLHIAFSTQHHPEGTSLGHWPQTAPPPVLPRALPNNRPQGPGIAQTLLKKQLLLALQDASLCNPDPEPHNSPCNPGLPWLQGDTPPRPLPRTHLMQPITTWERG